MWWIKSSNEWRWIVTFEKWWDDRLATGNDIGLPITAREAWNAATEEAAKVAAERYECKCLNMFPMCSGCVKNGEASRIAAAIRANKEADRGTE